MNDDIENPPLAPRNADGATLLFGIDVNDPVLAQHGLQPSKAIVGDSRHVTQVFFAQNPCQTAICPLFAGNKLRHHDALTVIETLCAAQFIGELVVLAPPLPRPKMVEGELRALAKGIKLRLIASALPPATEI